MVVFTMVALAGGCAVPVGSPGASGGDGPAAGKADGPGHGLAGSEDATPIHIEDAIDGTLEFDESGKQVARYEFQVPQGKSGEWTFTLREEETWQQWAGGPALGNSWVAWFHLYEWDREADEWDFLLAGDRSGHFPAERQHRLKYTLRGCDGECPKYRLVASANNEGFETTRTLERPLLLDAGYSATGNCETVLVKGTLEVAENGVPARAVRVAIGTASTETDDNGEFELRDVPPGPVALKLGPNGEYRPSQCEMDRNRAGGGHNDLVCRQFADDVPDSTLPCSETVENRWVVSEALYSALNPDYIQFGPGAGSHR
jgi:hypothetical protein